MTVSVSQGGLNLQAVHALEKCINSIDAWMKLDKLKLNSDKTEIILVGTRPQLNKIRFDHLKVGHVAYV